ncbi:MAG TPA: hypothetical protein PKD02_10245, partial [Thermomonas sp.]|nr:hypothetical protein [Thermomonas sp.]
MTDRTGVVPVPVMVVVVVMRDMGRLCCSAAKAVKRWLQLEPVWRRSGVVPATTPGSRAAATQRAKARTGRAATC